MSTGRNASVIDLLTAAGAAFMVPVAGLALAHFRFQLISFPDEAGAGAKRNGRSVLLPFVVSFLVVTLVYPVLLLLVFYFMGKRLDMDSWGLKRFEKFGLSVFLGGAAGLLAGAILSLPFFDSSISALFASSNLGNLI
jgi:hypothetical protein